MKVLLGAIAAEGRGQLGGVVGSRNRYGAYLRNNTSPVNPNTVPQQEQRSAFAIASRYWRDTLTAAQRDAWDQYAAMTPIVDVFGLKQTLPGNTLFCAFNSTMVRRGVAILAAAPVTPGQAPMTLITLTGTTAAGIQVTAVTPDNAAGDINVIQRCVAPVSQARNFFNGPFTYVAHIVGPWALPHLLIGPAFVAVGQRWFFRFRMYEVDGRVGPPSVFSVDILV